MLTSCWSSGDAGPVAFCISEGALDKDQIHSFNMANKGTAMVISSGSKTHFMSGEILVEVFEQLYGVAFARQRQRLGLRPDSMGALVCDAWGGTFTHQKGIHIRRP